MQGNKAMQDSVNALLPKKCKLSLQANKIDIGLGHEHVLDCAFGDDTEFNQEYRLVDRGLPEPSPAAFPEECPSMQYSAMAKAKAGASTYAFGYNAPIIMKLAAGISAVEDPEKEPLSQLVQVAPQILPWKNQECINICQQTLGGTVDENSPLYVVSATWLQKPMGAADIVGDVSKFICVQYLGW